MSVTHLIATPYASASRALTVLVVVLAIRRTMNILKIFKAFSPIIIMILDVVTGLN